MSLAIRSSAALAALALGSVLTVSALPAAADDQAVVTMTNEHGTDQALSAGGTTMELSGSGFQSVVGGMGGIYVAFGWVDDPDSNSWGPSAGGENGHNYKFAPDDESADNDGYLKFVTFPGAATSAAANGGVLDEDGTWATELAIPPAQFDSKDREGNMTQVDCLEVQCGIVTIGAHNVNNANNETFTPVDFVAEYEQEQPAQETPAAEPTDTASEEPAETPQAQEVDPAGSDTDGQDLDSADTDSADNDADATAQDAASGTNRGLIFGAIGAAIVVGLMVLRRFLARRMNS